MHHAPWKASRGEGKELTGKEQGTMAKEPFVSDGGTVCRFTEFGACLSDSWVFL